MTIMAPEAVGESLDPRDPLLRLSTFFDDGSVELLHERDRSGVLAAAGAVNGVRTIAFCTDGTVMGGAMGVEGCAHIVNAYDTAIEDQSPIVGIWHSGGARLAEGVKALEQALVRPLSFSFGREEEAYHMLLPAYGIRCYRGRTPVLACELGRTLPGALLRALDELVRASPPLVWPHETLPGLWNIPSSLFLYPIGPLRTRFLALPSRSERFRRGLEAAARYRGIFHFCLHPENLAESPQGFSLLDDMLEQLIKARDRGDVEILTMDQVAARMERALPEVSPRFRPGRTSYSRSSPTNGIAAPF